LRKPKVRQHIQKKSEKTYMRWLEELKALEAQKEALSKEIEATSATTALMSKIKRPQGASIQEGMGLSDNKPKYDAIRVCPHVNAAAG
jgi:hypothetical protein